MLDTVDISAPPAPSADELLERARSLVPLIFENGPQAERDRHVPDAVIGALRAGGLFRALQPRRWGGSEVSLARFFEILMTIAEGDMSTGWISGVLGVAPWVLGLLDDRAAREVWSADPSALIGSALAPSGKITPADGGVRLQGHWRYGSGSTYADWMLLGGLAQEAGAPPEWRIYLLPKTELRLVDTWHTSGLRGTGSFDVIVEDAFVPGYRMRRMTDNVTGVGPGQAVNTGSLYRIPFGHVFGGGVAYGSIGALRGMLNAFCTFAQSRVRMTGKSTLDDPDAQLVIAEADYAIDELTTIALRNAAELQAYADRGELPPDKQRLKYKFQTAMACERCRSIAAQLFAATGTSGILTEHPFGRILADITAGRQHITNQRELYAREWGNVLFGRPVADDLMQ